MIPVCTLDDLDIYRPGDKTRNLASRWGCDELTAAVIDSRGEVSSPLGITAGENGNCPILEDPGLREHLASLNLGAGASEAASLWVEAVPEKRVFVYGDYDVDGVSSTVMALEFARRSGAAETVYYIPDRQREGYGLHAENMKQIIADGFETLIVVDCGSKDVEAVTMAREAGMNVIIFDHHAVEGEVVDLETLVNPQIDGNDEAKRLCATTVLWCWAWQTHILPAAQIVPFLQLGALATVSDCMPLGPLNRSITREGVALIRKSPMRGLRELILALCPNEPFSMVDETVLAMKIIPCLNAAGRVYVADVAVNVLSGMGSAQELMQSVDALLELNRRRRTLSVAICKSIDEDRENGNDNRVLYDASWPVGILSAIASRLCNEHNKAFALAAPSGGGIRGTLRVPRGADAVAVLKGFDELLDAWGGHKYAAGFSVSPQKWKELSSALDDELRSIREIAVREEVIEMRPAHITGESWRDMLRAGPFGNGNPAPSFFVPVDSDTTYAELGKKGLHKKVMFPDGTSIIAFNSAEQIENTPDIRGWIYQPRLNFWQGRFSLQYIAKSMVTA